VEDSHVVGYSLKKLVSLGVVQTEKSGKEVLYFPSELGQQLVKRYREIREECLIDPLVTSGTQNADIGDMAKLLRTMSGLYDQAARAASSL
jgi:predicted MarR family transcription regulator